jgi:hypothetical protein
MSGACDCARCRYDPIARGEAKRRGDGPAGEVAANVVECCSGNRSTCVDADDAVFKRVGGPRQSAGGARSIRKMASARCAEALRSVISEGGVGTAGLYPYVRMKPSISASAKSIAASIDFP